jgi:chain length determinant protein (polysaccharide antigen chain regulator)
MMIETNSYKDDDLLELLKKIWNGKLIILFVVLFMMLCSLIYIKSSHQKWVSTRVVTTIEQTKINEIRYDIIDNSDYFYNNLMFDNYLLPATFLNLYINEFNDKKNKTTFNNQHQIKLNNIDTLAVKKISNISYLLTNSSSSKQKNITILNDYDKYINKVSREKWIANLKGMIKNNIIDLSYNLKAEKVIEKTKIKLAIKNTENALKIANIEGVSSPIPDIDSTNVIYPISLGSKILSKKLAILKALDKDKPNNIAIDKSTYKLDELKNIKLDNITLPSYFEFINSNNIESHVEGPKKALIIVLFVFIGLILGSAIVLIKSKYEKYHD